MKNKELTLSEYKDKIRILEGNIYALIKEFEEDTHETVKSVELESISYTDKDRVLAINVETSL